MAATTFALVRWATERRAGDHELTLGRVTDGRVLDPDAEPLVYRETDDMDGSSSGIDARRGEGPFVAVTQTRNDAAAQVLEVTLAEMRRLGAKPIPAAELEARATTSSSLEDNG